MLDVARAPSDPLASFVVAVAHVDWREQEDQPCDDEDPVHRPKLSGDSIVPGALTISRIAD